MQLASDNLALPKMSKSSANRRWWKARVFIEICRPLIRPALSFLNMSLENISDPRMKRKGVGDHLALSL